MRLFRTTLNDMHKYKDYISIIIPGYNEEKRIHSTLKAILQFCSQHFERHEIIFVDDGSTDHTWNIVNDIAFDSSLKAIQLPENRGKGHAVKLGMLQASGKYRFFTDADLPYEPKSFLSSIELFNAHGCDMVVGARELPESTDKSKPNLNRKISSYIFSTIVDNLIKTDIKDTQCGFKGFTEDAAKKIFSKSTIGGYAFDVEIFLLAKHMNLHIQKVPVTLVRNKHSKIRLSRDVFIMLTDILRLYERQRRGKVL
ncbi:MAG: hypothetical protein SRB1_02113 [Desulfobacteraceae bacterium Eth-SRB1]|nr:MAG: hypothetical protein SRB1_02113 [Desulfobacteraceae bacterium Eth-SRB1]